MEKRGHALSDPDAWDKSLHKKIFAKNMQIIFLRD
jgi:hypothetical protein